MLTYAGTSHRRAPLAIRERIAIPGERVPDVLGRLTERFGCGTLLATCNRLELYLVGDHDRAEVLDFIAAEVAIDRGSVERHFEVAHGGAVVRHLYAVSSGVESMVLGESEILGQVRTALSHTVRAGADHALLTRLFDSAIRVGRRARTETAIGRNALSISSVAVQQVRQLTLDLTTATVLVIGAGEAGRLAAASLVDHGVAEVLVANRTYRRAEALAGDLNGRAYDFDHLVDALVLADVVIAAADAPQPLVSEGMVHEALARRDGAPLLIVDIGVPRDVDAAVRGMAGITYFDIDDLQSIATSHATARAGEVEHVEAIIEEETGRFFEWWEQMAVVPTITALTERADRVRSAELEKTLRRMAASGASNVPDELEERLEAMTRAIVKQLLHDPIMQLRQRGDRRISVDAVRTLFRLDDHVPSPGGPIG